jgi:hypothetical protein
MGCSTFVLGESLSGTDDLRIRMPAIGRCQIVATRMANCHPIPIVGGGLCVANGG